MSGIDIHCLPFYRTGYQLLAFIALISVFRTYFKRAVNVIGGEAVSIVSIVVVQRSTGINITSVISVTNVRRTKPPLYSRYPFHIHNLPNLSLSDFLHFCIKARTSTTKDVQYAILPPSMLYFRYASSIRPSNFAVEEYAIVCDFLLSS